MRQPASPGRDVAQREPKAALKKEEEDKKAGKEKKQRKNSRVDVREAAFVAEVERVEENDDDGRRSG